MEKNIKKDKRVLKGEFSKNKIIKTAIVLFSKKGYDATSINDIAKKADITKSLFYHYFTSKESILLQIIEDYQIKIKRILDAVLQKDKISNFDEFFLGMQNTTQDFLLENRMFVKIIMAESFKNKIFTFKLFKIFFDFHDYICQIAMKHIDFDKKQDKLIYELEEFFFHFIPTIIFSAFLEYWSEYNKIPQEKIRKEFFNILKNKHEFNNEFKILKS